jgi:hypothetical protein
MPTLAQLIAIHEDAQPAPIALTPLAEARVAARRLARAVVALDDRQDRLDVMVYATAEAARLLTEDATTPN